MHKLLSEKTFLRLMPTILINKLHAEARVEPKFQLSKLAPTFAVILILLGCLAYGYSLDRYPQFYVDDVVFAYPALQAAQGHTFAYTGGGNAPFVNEIWAYHGPVLPNLQILLFKLFGYNFALSRLPNFIGSWMAALLIVLFFTRRGYRYAGLIFAVLWCGDRAVQESMYDRMDGLALLGLVLSFLLLENVWHNNSRRSAAFFGFLSGFCVLIHPLCAIFTLFSFLLVLYRRGWRQALWFCLAGLLNLPLLLMFWRFHPVKSWIQFRTVAVSLNKITGLSRSVSLLVALRWSRYWFAALVAVAVVCSAGALIAVLRKQVRTESGTDLLLASSFGLASLVLLTRSSLYPYYIIYFSVWPMMCIAILTERYWRRFAIFAGVLFLVWCSSAAWNFMRLREAVLFRSAIDHRVVDAELERYVPHDATIITSSEFYAVPIEAGYPNRGLISFEPTNEDICHQCYLLITPAMYNDGKYIPRTNLDLRKILYKGPAFPAAGPLGFPIVILSPQR